MHEYSITSDLGFNKTEFDFLSQFMLSKKPHIDWKACNFEDYINYIIEIRKQIRINTIIANHEFLESSHRGLIRKKYQNNYFQYSYQRYDLSLINEHWLEQIYNINMPQFRSNGFFVKSGMAAFLVTIVTLKRLYPKLNSIHYDKNGYFEINDMLTKHLNLYKIFYLGEDHLQQPDLVVLDSTTCIVESTYWIKAKVIIIDTTCWATNDPILFKILETLKNCDYKGLIILVRSHIKLDCFGLEVNRLGSVLILTNINSGNNLDSEFKKSSHETACNIGCNFNIEDCYPWLFNKKFHEISNIRTNKIKHYTNQIYNKLSQHLDLDHTNFIISKGQHDLFIIVKFSKTNKNPNKIFKHSDPIVRYARQVCSVAKSLGLPLVPSSSFGLCYTSLDGHKSRTGTEAYLRLAPSPNINETQINLIADFLIEWFYKKNYVKL